MAIILGEHQYGKAENRIVRIVRDSPRHEIRDVNVSTCLRGRFDAAHLTGDQGAVLPTDTQKQTSYAFAKTVGLESLERYALALATHFTADVEPVDQARVELEEYAWERVSVGGEEHDFSWVRTGQEIRTVAVTVDADNDELDEIIALMGPDILQFHGHESPERVLTIKAVTGLPIIKAFSIRDADDLKRIEPYIGIADRFLFDAKPPAGSDLPGGNGVTFDWSLLRSLDESVDYMLSGGLNKDNIAEALSETGARAIDISSGVESAPGVKDLQLMDEFFAAVTEASRQRAHSGSIK